LATDYARLTDNLLHFYDFKNKVVLFVGAGVKQLLTPSAGAKKIVAIDQDVAALRELAESVVAQGLQGSLETVGRRFEEVELAGDVVYFEFCLHEMTDPERALAHAKALASDVVVMDHSPGSEWIYYGAKEDKVQHSAEVMERLGVRRHERFQAEQRFENYAEFLAKVTPQGPVAIERAQRFAVKTNIVIPMSYDLNLL